MSRFQQTCGSNQNMMSPGRCLWEFSSWSGKEDGGVPSAGDHEFWPVLIPLFCYVKYLAHYWTQQNTWPIKGKYLMPKIVSLFSHHHIIYAFSRFLSLHWNGT